MVAGLQHANVVVLDHVDQAMLAIDSSGPAALEDMAQRFGLSDAGEGSRSVSSMSRLIRFSVFLSTDCQWR